MALSGYPVDEHFREGWALKFFGHRKAHHWTRYDQDAGYTACRGTALYHLRVKTGQLGLFTPSDTERCKVCERVVEKRNVG